MAGIEKLVKLLLREPPDVSSHDVVKVLEAFGYKERPSESGHRVFSKPGAYPITVPTVKGRKVKRIYVKKIIEYLELEEWYDIQRNA